MSELLKLVKEMARKEKKLKEYKRKIRVRGKIVRKGLTKKGNIRLKVKKNDIKYNFVVVKTHKERFDLAQKLKIGEFVYAEGINRFRAVICTKLKQIKRIDESKQSKLEGF